MPRLRGLGTSRKGRPLIGLQTLVDRVRGGREGFRRKMAAVSVEDAEEAANVLRKSRTQRQRFTDAALVGGAMSPLVRGVGRAAEAAVMGKKGRRWQAAMGGVKHKNPAVGLVRGFKNTTKGEVAKHVLEGGLGGAAVNAAREGREIGRAKRKAMEFVDEGKTGLAQAFNKSLSALGKRVQPVPTSKLAPIVDDDYDFEV